jgi:hypothetical protein
MSGITSLTLTLVEFPEDEHPYLVFRIAIGERRMSDFPSGIGRLAHITGPPAVFVRGGFINSPEITYLQQEHEVMSLMEPGNDEEGVKVTELVTRDPSELVAVMRHSVRHLTYDQWSLPSEPAWRDLLASLYERLSTPSLA